MAGIIRYEKGKGGSSQVVSGLGYAPGYDTDGNEIMIVSTKNGFRRFNLLDGAMYIESGRWFPRGQEFREGEKCEIYGPKGGKKIVTARCESRFPRRG